MSQNGLKELLGGAESLYRDLTFTAVREWKARTGGLQGLFHRVPRLKV